MVGGKLRRSGSYGEENNLALAGIFGPFLLSLYRLSYPDTFQIL
jgi:hypothetical protein